MTKKVCSLFRQEDRDADPAPVVAAVVTTAAPVVVVATTRPRDSIERLFDAIYRDIDALPLAPLRDLVKTQVGFFQWLATNVFGF